MTKLIVKPIDPAAAGSWRERKDHRRISARLVKAQESGDMAEQFAVIEEMEDWIVGRLQTDDGTPVEEALDRLSVDEWNTLMSAAQPGDSVGEASAGS